MAAPKTFFEVGRKSFKDVPVTNGEIATSEFLEACESVVAIFDLLESTAFNVVKNDMTGNIKKVRDRQLSHPALSETLQALVKNEMAEKKKVASEGLLWLNRGLSFTATALRKNVNSDETLSTSFTGAYSDTLRKHHGMLVRGVFSVAMKACPTSDFFYTKLAGRTTQPGTTLDPEVLNKVKVDLEEWLTSLELCVDILNKWIENLGIS